jgi:hypothetical protein
MAFDKKKKDTSSSEDVAQEEFGAEEEAIPAEISRQPAEVEEVVEVSNYDPFRRVKVVPRISNAPNSSMSFRCGGVDYQITDNKPTTLPIDVARQLKEKGYIPSLARTARSRSLRGIFCQEDSLSHRRIQHVDDESGAGTT